MWKRYPFRLCFISNSKTSMLMLPHECGPTISDHTKKYCRNKRSMITLEAWTPVIINSQCYSIKWIERSTKYVLPRIQVNIFVYIFFVLFFCLLPHCRFIIFYKWLGWSLGWEGFVTSAQSEEKERARAGLTSDTSLGFLALDGNAFSVRSRSKILLNTTDFSLP